SGVVRAMIPRHIPTVYLEGYAELQSLCDKLHWPKKPRLIFTSNSYDSDEVFKAWAAGKVEAGVPLAVGQHGGNYGVDRWNFAEDHECSISDSWLSWGWDDKRRPQIKPVGNLKMFGIDMHKRGAEGYALMVEMTMSRYSYRMHSVPMAGQWLDYFNEQCRFVDALPDEIRGRLLVRLYVHDCGWYQAARWREHFPEIQLDDGRGPIAPLIEKSRIYVSTYNATTYLESLAMNIPTIMFWNPNHWELRNSAVPYFERLKAVGIFHETPEAAAHQMTQVWDNVAAWWNSEPVQAAREEFCYRYSRMPKKPLEDLGQTLRQISYSATE
ncbi:MAG: LIC12162 family protein, partial [Deltaproteobacteria bacterium]